MFFCSYESASFFSVIDRTFLVMHIRSPFWFRFVPKVQWQAATVDPKKIKIPGEECLKCCVVFFLRSLDDVSLPTHINMSENRNMYLSFASLGVVNDLTCLIIIYYVFLGRKKGQRAEAGPRQRMFQDPTRDPILSICQMCLPSSRIQIMESSSKRFHLFIYPSTRNMYVKFSFDC